jgi:hypothetical protein
MKRFVVLLVAVALVTLGPFWASPACAQRQPRSNSGKKVAQPKPETFIVIQTGSEFEVIKSTEFPARLKTAKEKYQQEQKAYKAAEKEAKSKKEKFDMPKPVQVLPKRVGPGSFKTKTDAEAYREKRKQQRDDTKSSQPN